MRLAMILLPVDLPFFDTDPFYNRRKVAVVFYYTFRVSSSIKFILLILGNTKNGVFSWSKFDKSLSLVFRTWGLISETILTAVRRSPSFTYIWGLIYLWSQCTWNHNETNVHRELLPLKCLAQRQREKNEQGNFVEFSLNNGCRRDQVWSYGDGSMRDFIFCFAYGDGWRWYLVFFCLA